jgi:hypothetical protein
VIYFVFAILLSLSGVSAAQSIPNSDDPGCEIHVKTDSESSSFKRFSKILDVIEADNTGFPSTQARVENMLAKDTRGSVFRLQALLRTFEEHAQHGADFEKARRKSKDFEDFLGHYRDRRKFLERITALGLPAPVLKHVGTQVEEDRGTLFEFLEKRWSIEQGAKWKEKYRPDFNKITGIEEQNFLVTEVSRFLSEEVLKVKWDFHKLQDGIHEFRRRLRWALLMIQASGGFFELVEEAPLQERFAKYLVGSGVSEASFSKIPVLFRDARRCQISRPVFEMATLVVFKVGDAKDWGEFRDFIKEAYVGAKYSEAEAVRESQRIAESQPGFTEPFPLATHWKEILDSEKILQRLIENLKRCLGK